MTPRRASSSATARGSWSTLSDRRRASSATSVSSASRPASRSASGSKRGSSRARPRASWSATAAVSRAPAPSWVRASRRDAAPRAIASPCWAAVRRPRISSASPGRRCARRDLGRLVLEQVQPARHLARVERGRIERGPVLAPPLDGAGHRAAQLLVATEAVEQVALPALVEQAALVVLAVDLDEGADLVRQAGRGDRRVVDARRGPAAGRDLADRDQRLRQPIEQRLDARGLGAVADQGRVGAGAHREPEGVDQQALAGARLAGDDVEAGIEREAQPVDEREVGDRQLQEAARRRRGRRSRRQQLHLVAQQVPERAGRRAGGRGGSAVAGRGPRRRRRPRSAGPRGRPPRRAPRARRRPGSGRPAPGSTTTERNADR